MRKPRRFWSKVDVGEADECWEWLASKSRGGYGQFAIHSKPWLAHRVAWFLTFGPIPKGLCVCHHCDNPGCANPYHLFLGTHAENIADSVRKGRMHRGEASGCGKLTEEDVHEIRAMLEEGYTQQEIADKFGVTNQSISSIKTGKKWAWLGEEG